MIDPHAKSLRANMKRSATESSVKMIKDFKQKQKIEEQRERLKLKNNKKQFMTWANSTLAARNKRVESLKDFCDGVLLIHLVEVGCHGK